jgi:hypothetical protein
MYAIKVEFDTQTSMNAATQILPFRDLESAAGTYNKLVMDFLYTRSVSSKGGKPVEILGVWKYEVEADNDESAIEAVRLGKAILIDHTEEPDFPLNGD